MPKIPTAPQHLSAESRRLWRLFHTEYELDDRAAILLLQTALEARDRMAEAQAKIKKDGLTILDRFEQPKPHPLLVAERDSRAQMLQALKALNLDILPAGKPGRPGGQH